MTTLEMHTIMTHHLSDRLLNNILPIQRYYIMKKKIYNKIYPIINYLSDYSHITKYKSTLLN